MIYQLLTDEGRLELRRQRVLELEADHYRQLLIVEETNGEQGTEMLDEIARRIGHHMQSVAIDDKE